MKLFGFLIITIFAGLFLSSCSEYGKALKGDDFEAKFAYANQVFEKGSYDKALPLFEQIYQRSPKSDKGEVAFFRMAKCFYETGDFYMAGYYFGQFPIRFPMSEKAEEATFLRALCSVKNSPEYTLDQQQTEIAILDLQLFANQYPESELMDSCNRTIDRLRFKLERKKFDAVKLYDKMEDNRAALTSATVFVEEYPRSMYYEEALKIQYENAYKLAINSVLSKKKERIENAMNIYSKSKPMFTSSGFGKKASRYNETLEKELIRVDEQYAFNEIEEAFKNSFSISEQKKTQYLKETIKKFDNFATKYPNSNLLEKARNMNKRAQKELKDL